MVDAFIIEGSCLLHGSLLFFPTYIPVVFTFVKITKNFGILFHFFYSFLLFLPPFPLWGMSGARPYESFLAAPRTDPGPSLEGVTGWEGG